MVEYLVFLFCFTSQGLMVGADLCHDVYRIGSKYFYCDNCCGSWDDEYCCSNLGTAVIVGAVIGSLIGLGILVALIIICIKQSGRTTGRVLPANNSAINVVQMSHQQGSQMNGYHPHGQYPPHGQYHQPGNSHQTPGAYPPGPPPYASDYPLYKQ